jgi:MFS family permease
MQMVMGNPDLLIVSMEDRYKMPQAQIQSTEVDNNKKHIVLGLAAAFLIYAVSFYYLQTMGVARPRMAAELNGMPMFSWLISIPGLAGALATLLFSKFSDIYGRRSMLTASLSLCLLGTILSAISPTFMSLIIASTITSMGLGGLGFGAIPTISTLTAQCIVPKRMLGVAMGALFFNLTLSMTIAPAILGSAMNIEYADSLRASLPPSLDQIVGRETRASLSDPGVLLMKPAMRELQKRFDIMGNEGKTLFAETVQAIRTSLQSGLSVVFLIGAATMLLAFLLILAIPEISIDVEVKDEKAPELLELDLTAD